MYMSEQNKASILKVWNALVCTWLAYACSSACWWQKCWLWLPVSMRILAIYHQSSLFTLEQVDPAQQRHARWTQCSYSGRPLTEPVVADEGGALYNKADLVQGLANKAAGGAWPEGLSHIQRLKDLLPVRPQANPEFGRRALACSMYLPSNAAVTS